MIQENHSLNIWERQATSNKGLMKTKQGADAADREMKEGMRDGVTSWEEKVGAFVLKMRNNTHSSSSSSCNESRSIGLVQLCCSLSSSLTD
jgi:hypothetical protein